MVGKRLTDELYVLHLREVTRICRLRRGRTPRLFAGWRLGAEELLKRPTNVEDRQLVVEYDAEWKYLTTENHFTIFQF